ncbi:MAG: hypothetical protein K8R34_10740 [Methanosarcinales archaeon]|nr:hypothetical protein [Methanosarcinales archaeon]
MDSNTAVRNFGIGMAVIGIILLVGYVFYNILTIESNLILKLSLAAIISGIIIALLSLIMERIGTKDTEIERKY